MRIDSREESGRRRQRYLSNLGASSETERVHVGVIGQPAADLRCVFPRSWENVDDSFRVSCFLCEISNRQC